MTLTLDLPVKEGKMRHFFLDAAATFRRFYINQPIIQWKEASMFNMPKGCRWKNIHTQVRHKQSPQSQAIHVYSCHVYFGLFICFVQPTVKILNCFSLLVRKEVKLEVKTIKYLVNWPWTVNKITTDCFLWWKVKVCILLVHWRLLIYS